MQDIMEDLQDEGVPRIEQRNVFKARNYGFESNFGPEATLAK